MAIKLYHEEKIRPAEITSVDIMPHSRRLKHTNNPDPQTPLAAKFSVQYIVGRALQSGALRLDDFEGEAHFDEEVRNLMTRMHAHPHPDMPDDSAEQFGAEIIVTLTDGRIVSRRVNSLVGRGGEDPLSLEELWEKFSDCSGRVLPKHTVAEVFESLSSLEKIDNIQTITQLLKTA